MFVPNSNKTEKPLSKKNMIEKCKRKPRIDMHHMERKLYYECARFAKAVAKLTLLYKQVKCEVIEKNFTGRERQKMSKFCCFEFLHDAWL